MTEKGSSPIVLNAQGHIMSVAVSTDGTFMISASTDRTLKVWDLHSGQLLTNLEGHGDEVYRVTLTAQDTMALSVSKDRSLKVWDLQSNKCRSTIIGHTGHAYGLAVTRDGKTAATASEDRSVKLWDVESGKCRATLQGHAAPVWTVVLTPDEKMLVSGSADMSAKVWDLETQRCLATLVGHTADVRSVAVTPNGKTLITASHDKTLRVWDLESYECLRVIEGHAGYVWDVIIIPDRRIVASASYDHSLRIWGIDSGRCLGILEGHTSHVHAVAVTSDGRTMISGAWDSTLRIWNWEEITSTGYTSAKVVLVGESNVGKSYLAHRIATGSPPQEGTIKSTHGMRFWPLQPTRLGSRAVAPDGERREVVLWDMGGQEEYRLIHQLFLHDTTVALILLDPTRGTTAFKEAEAWNKSLEKQLRNRIAVKLLVGTKLDQPSELIDRQGLERLRTQCGFVEYCGTSAITGRGVPELCDAVAKAIDWDGLGKTSRPALFQRIRDEIESRRQRNEVVVSVCGLIRSLTASTQTNQEADAVNAVADQLAAQGVIARSQLSTGEPVLVLQVQEIERYAGSLIVAARNNPRGVPALELQVIAREDFGVPGIAKNERLPRDQEKPVIECTVQLMLEHGICFQHEGLLVFPSLFAATPQSADERLPHAVSLHYDFAGAIDNIYASLVAWLVLAKEFGKLRLWADRAEFEIKDGGLCGLRKVGRPGGFAHVDLYFEADTPEQKRNEFISFVEDHLARNGVHVREHIAIKCACGHEFAEETLRQRIARGEKDVQCPVCETRHSLSEGAAVAREKDTKIAQHTWALRTQIEKLREKMTLEAVQVLARTEEARPATEPICLLHMSDLHFTQDTPVEARLQWLLDDLKATEVDGGLGLATLDYLVISGDFTDKGSVEGFEKAYDFVSGLTQAFGLSAERCIFVPGNHDVRDMREAYEWHDQRPIGRKDDECVLQGGIVLMRNNEKYPFRFKLFSDSFYHKFLQRPYPTASADQGLSIPFWETGIQFLAFNSCWQVDQFHRKRSGVHVEAVAHAIRQAQEQSEEAQKSSQFAADRPLLRIAVWHHAVSGPDMMKDTDFLGNLKKNGVRLALHGDVHEMTRGQVGYQHSKMIHIVGSGSFGARQLDRPESTPRLYNVLKIDRSLKSVRVHTRCQRKADGPWGGWHEWPDPSGKGQLPFYDIDF